MHYTGYRIEAEPRPIVYTRGDAHGEGQAEKFLEGSLPLVGARAGWDRVAFHTPSGLRATGSLVPRRVSPGPDGGLFSGSRLIHSPLETHSPFSFFSYFCSTALQATR